MNEQIRIVTAGMGSFVQCPACHVTLADHVPLTRYHEGAQIYPLIDAPCAQLVMTTHEVSEEIEEWLKRHLCRECRCGYGWIESLEMDEPEGE